MKNVIHNPDVISELYAKLYSIKKINTYFAKVSREVIWYSTQGLSTPRYLRLNKNKACIVEVKTTTW